MAALSSSIKAGETVDGKDYPEGEHVLVLTSQEAQMLYDVLLHVASSEYTRAQYSNRVRIELACFVGRDTNVPNDMRGTIFLKRKE